LADRRYGNPSGRTTEIEVVRAIYDAFARRDLSEALRHFHEDAEMIVPGTAAAVGHAGPYRGHAGIREYFADVERAWEQLQLHADDIRAIADTIVVLGHITGRIADAPTRRRVVWTWRLRDGQVASVQANDLGEDRS
jgi:ketosteroid isomerase-like protein